MKVYVPSSNELEKNITEKVIDSFSELVFVAESGSYEMRSCFRLLDEFEKKTNKASYGSLKHFANYCSNVARYYKNPKAKELLKQIVSDVDRFIDTYEYFLL